MGNAIGAVLPLALGIALSPIPIIATILLLLSPKARTAAVGFAVGWLLGILTTLFVFLLVSAVIPTPNVGGVRPVQGSIHLLLGAVLVVLSAREFRMRSRSLGRSAELPAWIRAIDRLGFRDALGLGILLAAVNPKNLILGASAGVVLGTANLAVSSAVAAIAVYVLVASSTILAPVIGVVVVRDRLHRPLDALRSWLERENAVIMGVVLLVLGVVVIAKGLAYL
jgi:hypothetical protein